MADRRRANVTWSVADQEGRCHSVAHAQLAVLMDLRDELQKLNRLLHCPEFLKITRLLQSIARQTDRPRKRKP